MINIMKVISMVVLVAVFGNSYAESTPGYSGRFEVKSTQVLSRYIIINISEEDSLNLRHADDRTDKSRLAIEPVDDAKRKEMLSVALAATVSGKSVSGWINNCTEHHADTSVTFPRLGTIYIHAD